MNHDGPGKFVTLEGIEGVGKTTNMRFIEQLLDRAGIASLLTREPGGTERAEAIRDLVLTPADEELTDLAELLLMFAARAQHVENKVRPALESGRWVICDRFTDATLAYQGFGRGQDIDRIKTLAGWVHGDLQPDLTLLFDLSVEVSDERRRARTYSDRFERERRAFFRRVRDGYLELAALEPSRYAVIDASGTLDEVQRQVRDFLESKLDITL